MDLPKPFLGEVSALTISTPDLELSFKYYQRLGFYEVLRFGYPFPWIQITDGALLIMLREDKTKYIALTYYVKDIESIVNYLDKNGVVFTSRAKDQDILKRYIFETVDGFNISLVNIMDGFKQPPEPTMLKFSQSDYFNPEKYPNKICGLYGEYAQPVKDLDASIKYWEMLGFKTISKYESPYRWAILSDGLNTIGLHQSSHFKTPAITYFASDMKAKVEKLIAEGLENYKEVMGGNYVLTTPEGQTINLFKLGM